MARITVEDCLEKINSQYDLVLLAKERTAQLNAGEQPLVPQDNDKNTVISLREIGEGKVSIKNLEDAGINKLRKHYEEKIDVDELEEENEDNFDKIYKGEISKSGAAILPSKRVRRVPEKINLESQSIDEKKSEDIKESKQEAPNESAAADIKEEQ
jgi:DNA-directed RNA polymerase subunit omega